MKLASMTDQEALISKLRSNIVRKRLNTMIWHANTQGMRPPAFGTELSSEHDICLPQSSR